jgi:hypothetical protein
MQAMGRSTSPLASGHKSNQSPPLTSKNANKMKQHRYPVSGSPMSHLDDWIV